MPGYFPGIYFEIKDFSVVFQHREKEVQSYTEFKNSILFFPEQQIIYTLCFFVYAVVFYLTTEITAQHCVNSVFTWFAFQMSL